MDNVSVDVKLRSVGDGLVGDNLRMFTAAELTTSIEQNEENVTEEELIFAAEEPEEEGQLYRVRISMTS